MREPQGSFRDANAAFLWQSLGLPGHRIRAQAGVVYAGRR
jgi:hypothetical protein